MSNSMSPWCHLHFLWVPRLRSAIKWARLFFHTCVCVCRGSWSPWSPWVYGRITPPTHTHTQTHTQTRWLLFWTAPILLQYIFLSEILAFWFPDQIAHPSLPPAPPHTQTLWLLLWMVPILLQWISLSEILSFLSVRTVIHNIPLNIHYNTVPSSLIAMCTLSKGRGLR